MALYYNLPVYKDSYDLMLQLFFQTKSLPKEYKYTVGEKLKNEALALIIAIYEATKQVEKAKVECIEKAKAHLEIIRLLTRILKDLKIWSLKTIILLNTAIETISKQLSKWAVHCQSLLVSVKS